MRAASPPVSFSLRSLSSSYVPAPCEANSTCGRFLLFTVALVIGAEGRYFRNTVRRSQHSNK